MGDAFSQHPENNSEGGDARLNRTDDPHRSPRSAVFARNRIERSEAAGGDFREREEFLILPEEYAGALPRETSCTSIESLL